MEKRQLTISYIYLPSEKKVPFLRLQGIWLESLGFHVGDKVEIILEDNRLVITKTEAKEK